MIIIVSIAGAILGRLFIGGLLNFALKPEEHDKPNPENFLGWIGAVMGIIIAIIVYKVI